MPNGNRITKKATKISIGDMDTKVILYERSQKAPMNVKYKLQLSQLGSVWSMTESINGVDIFDGSNNLVGTATDVFSMYYIDRIAKKDDCGTIYVEYDGRLYEVLRVRVLDKKNKEFMSLYCVEKGKNVKTGVNIL